MKPVMVIAVIGIIVGLGILAVIVSFQQSEISDIRRQEYLESSVFQCNTIIVNVNYFSNEDVNRASQEWQSCMDEAMILYGNSFQKENWNKQKQEMNESWIQSDNFEETSDYDLEQYWALRNQDVIETMEKQLSEKEKQEMEERIDSCPEEMSMVDCMISTTIIQEKMPLCSSSGQEAVKYQMNHTFRHFADKNANGFYCKYYNQLNDVMLYIDDDGLR